MRLFQLLFFACLLLVPMSCRHVYEIDLNLPNVGSIAQDDVIQTDGTPKLRTRVFVLDSATTDQIISITDKKIVFKPGTKLKGGRMAATFDIGEVEVGSAIVSKVSSKTPQGLLVEVKGKIETSAGIEVDVETSSLDRIFEEIKFKRSDKLKAEINVNETLTVEQKPGSSGASASVQATGKASFSIDFKYGLEIEQLKLLSAYSTVELTREAELVIGANTALQGNPEKEIYKKTFTFTRWVFVGLLPIPIVINPTVTATLKSQLSVEGGFTARLFKVSDQYEYGAEFNEGTVQKVDKESSPSNGDPIQASVKGSVKAGIEGKLEIQFYKTEILTFGEKLFLFGQFDATCKTDGKGLEIKSSLGLENTAFAQLKIFGYEKSTETGGEFTVALPLLTLPVSLCGQNATPPDPIDNTTQRTPTANSTGDPHLNTFDQGRYDFMGAGEFIAAKSTTDRFEIQVRQQEVKSFSSSGQVSFNTGLAMHTGSDAVCIYPDGRIFLNQSRLNAGSAVYPLKNGWSLQQLNTQITIASNVGDQITVQLYSGTNLDYYVTLSAARKGTLKGLLGNFDGNSANDLIRGDNGQPVQNTFAAFYPTYADSWRIRQAESLFVYDTGKTTESYTDRSFPQKAVSLTAQQRAAAEAACRQKGITDPVALENCIFDLAVTNDNSLAQRALNLQTVRSVLNSFAIGGFVSTDVKLSYDGATAENNAAVLNTASSGFSRVVMNQGVNMSNGFISEFSFTAEEFNQSSCFYLALWPTTPASRNLNQKRAGFCFGFNNSTPITFYHIDGVTINGLPATAQIPPFNDKQVHKVRITEQRLSSNGWFRVSIFYDNMTTPVVSVSYPQSIAQIIEAEQNTGYIEFQINQGVPSKVKVFNWTFQAL